MSEGWNSGSFEESLGVWSLDPLFFCLKVLTPYSPDKPKLGIFGDFDGMWMVENLNNLKEYWLYGIPSELSYGQKSILCLVKLQIQPWEH
jgi:hypothetical protein